MVVVSSVVVAEASLAVVDLLEAVAEQLLPVELGFVCLQSAASQQQSQLVTMMPAQASN